MGRIRYASDVAAPVDVAFSYVENYRFIPQWLAWVSQLEPTGSSDQGLGAVFRTAAQCGPWHWTFETEVTEYRRNVVFALTSRHTLGGTHTIRFDRLGCGRSVLTHEMDLRHHWYLANRLATSMANTVVRRTEQRLRTGIEQYHGHDPVARIA
ncbi:MAG: SRPBCC family protein [Mycobacteriaceae bacterium]|nr:SRPBCC family protein [Mycobacteriaceae bacterium]